MQHQQDSTQLEQQINHIIWNSSETVLQQIAQTLERLRVDYCLVMVAVDDQAGQIFYWYFDKHLVVPSHTKYLSESNWHQ